MNSEGQIPSSCPRTTSMTIPLLRRAPRMSITYGKKSGAILWGCQLPCNGRTWGKLDSIRCCPPPSAVVKPVRFNGCHQDKECGSAFTAKTLPNLVDSKKDILLRSVSRPCSQQMLPESPYKLKKKKIRLHSQSETRYRSSEECIQTDAKSFRMFL